MAFVKTGVVCAVIQAIGVAIAFAVFKFGAGAVYSTNIAAAVAAGQAPVHAALVVIAYAIRLVNFIPMIYKEKVMKGALRDEIGANMRANPFIFKTVGTKSETVLFTNDGVTGQYNRANRSLAHMIENIGSFLAGLVLAGGVFPFPTFVLACAFGAGRVMHQVGYSSGYGKHGAGFMVSMLASITLEGLSALVLLAGLGLLPLSSELAPAAPDVLEGRVAELEALVKALTATAQ